ncbi:hypothetical protein HDE_03899 [Halotydeus destructor]|nr:hypothetical protein HDE_03899 [Halotydeus destructor]
MEHRLPPSAHQGGLYTFEDQNEAERMDIVDPMPGSDFHTQATTFGADPAAPEAGQKMSSSPVGAIKREELWF